MTERRDDRAPREPREPRREREVIVTERRGSTVGSIVRIIVGLIIAALIAWAIWVFAFAGEEGGVDVEVPENINVDTDAGGNGGS